MAGLAGRRCRFLAAQPGDAGGTGGLSSERTAEASVGPQHSEVMTPQVRVEEMATAAAESAAMAAWAEAAEATQQGAKAEATLSENFAAVERAEQARAAQFEAKAQWSSARAVELAQCKQAALDEALWSGRQCARQIQMSRSWKSRSRRFKQWSNSKRASPRLPRADSKRWRSHPCVLP